MESYDDQIYSVGGNFHSALKYQMSAVVNMMLARKVRVSIPDQSSLVLQTLGQLNEKSNPNQFQQIHNSNVQRYCISTEQLEEALSRSEVFPKFSSSTHNQPTLMLTDPAGSAADTNTSSDHSHVSSTITCTDTKSAPANKQFLTQVKSNPHISILPSLFGNAEKDTKERSDIISQYKLHDQSQSDLLEVSGGINNSVNKTIMPSFLPSDAQKSTEPNLSGTSSIGFGILSRTRQFGAWLTKATEGEKVKITKQDLNALAPNSF